MNLSLCLFILSLPLSLPAISLQKSPPEGSESVMKKLGSLFLSEIQTKHFYQQETANQSEYQKTENK